MKGSNMPKPKNPVLATMNVNVEGFRDSRHNDQRIDAAIKLIHFAKQASINCLCFPAGYLIASNEKAIPKRIKPITQEAKNSGVSFVIGVDLHEILHPRFTSADSPAMRRAVQTNKVPAFLITYSASNNSLQLHRQRSCTSSQANSLIVPDDIMKETRFMPLGKSGFQLILCGEIYDKRLFTEDKPKASIVFGHTTMPRLSRSLTSRSRLGFSILNTEHRTGRGGKLFCFNNGTDHSVISKPCFVNKEKGLWIDMAIWELNDRGYFTQAKTFKNMISLVE